MKIRRPIGRKGQVVIPKDLREYLGLKEGREVEFAIEDGKVLLKPAASAQEAVEAYVGAVKRKLKRHVNIKKIIEEEVTAEAQYMATQRDIKFFGSHQSFSASCDSSVLDTKQFVEGEVPRS